VVGQHNAEIWGEMLGLSGTELEALTARGVI